MTDRYVGRHRKARPHRHQRFIDHVEAATPCYKLRVGMALFLLVLGAVATYTFGGVAVAAPDSPQTVPVADVVADTPAVNAGCFR